MEELDFQSGTLNFIWKFSLPNKMIENFLILILGTEP